MGYAFINVMTVNCTSKLPLADELPLVSLLATNSHDWSAMRYTDGKWLTCSRSSHCTYAIATNHKISVVYGY